MIAFVPAVLYILPLMAFDRYDPEPFWLLALAFAGSSCFRHYLDHCNESFGLFVLLGTRKRPTADIAGSVISAPLFEEASKGFGLLLLLLFFRRHLTISWTASYTAALSPWFATVENVMYYGSGLNKAYDEYGVSPDALYSFLFLFSLRGILSPFAHVTFTRMTGIGCGIARESHNWAVRILMPMLARCCRDAGTLSGTDGHRRIYPSQSGLCAVCSELGLAATSLAYAVSLPAICCSRSPCSYFPPLRVLPYATAAPNTQRNAAIDVARA